MCQDKNDWQRHPDLYMSDGTIVLLADTTVFRVYAGFLATHSTVFQGLMESSQHLPTDTEDVYDGCPLVKLQDDVEDVAYFLKAMMGLCCFEMNKPTPYPMAAAVLRLSSKYMVQFLRQQAIHHFRRIIPRSFFDIGCTESFYRVFGVYSNQPHPFQLISLFRECQLLSFLPWQYYVACDYGIEKICQGDTLHNGKKICLDANDVCITLTGKDHLCASTRQIRNDAVTVPPTKECQKGSCNEIIRLAWMKYIAGDCNIGCRAMKQWKDFDILEPDCLIPPGKMEMAGRCCPCLACARTWLRHDQEARMAVWNRLPAIFKLPDWETLKRREML